MDLLNDARLQLESVVGADLLKEYFAILRQWFLLNSPVNKDEFDRQARKLLLNEDQIVAHNRFLGALLEKTSLDNLKISQTIQSPEQSARSKTISREEHSKGASKRFNFKPEEFSVGPSSIKPGDFSVRYAAEELFMPDHGLIASRIILTAWENGLQGAAPGVSDFIVYSCQTFVKNILTAMISRKKGFKMRDEKFQYGFNQPIPDPFLRNYINVTDDTVESRVEVQDDDDSFVPKAQPSLERMEQQLAFAYAGSKRRPLDNTLTVQLLYNTLRELPKLLGFGNRVQLHLLKLNLQLES